MFSIENETIDVKSWDFRVDWKLSFFPKDDPKLSVNSNKNSCLSPRNCFILFVIMWFSWWRWEALSTSEHTSAYNNHPYILNVFLYLTATRRVHFLIAKKHNWHCVSPVWQRCSLLISWRNLIACPLFCCTIHEPEWMCVPYLAGSVFLPSFPLFTIM